MITSTAVAPPELNVAQAYDQYRESRWTTEWGGVWMPPRNQLEQDAFAAGAEWMLGALAAAGLLRHHRQA